ncbi:hypothetical protein Zmor_003816 [Zophobas morio]|uniref:Uncharacterized protein n=1 Tax=Zophobas morio TaxID=2755281 RepID=A0AA38M1N1_9CUCU|nr:hypothetical protein Zmor_003816 [Zophobas morio]
MGTCLLRYPRRDVETQRRRSEFPVDVESRFLVTACPTDVGIHRIRSPTQNWLQFSITGITRSATKQKKLQGEQSLRRCSNSVNPKGSTCHMHLGCQGKANQKIYLRIDCSFSDVSGMLTNALQAIAPFRDPTDPTNAIPNVTPKKRLLKRTAKEESTNPQHHSTRSTKAKWIPFHLR